jgi:hypothetical protein
MCLAASMLTSSDTSFLEGPNCLFADKARLPPPLVMPLECLGQGTNGVLIPHHRMTSTCGVDRPNRRNFPLAYLLMGLPGLLANVPTSRREHPNTRSFFREPVRLSPTSLSVIDQGPRGVDVYTQASRPGRVASGALRNEGRETSALCDFLPCLGSCPGAARACSIIPLVRAWQNARLARCKKVWV